MDISAIEKQIKDIEDEIFNTQKNKATEHHIGKLKAKLARLKQEVEKRKSAGVKGKGFAIKKSGDATVALIGFPSIGKSTLINRLTGAKSRIGNYDFTTINAIPGMLKYNGADIQILDLPGLINGASRGKGRGKEILSAIRNVDLILFMIDAHNKDHLDIMAKELHMAGIRLNQKKPDIVVKKTGQGGINITSTTELTHLDKDLIKSISSEYVINADVTVREDITEDQLIDVFVQNRIYVPAFVIINKTDLISNKELEGKIREIRHKGWDVIAISAKKKRGLEKLKEKIFSELRFIRVYMKPVGKQADFEEPLILKEGDTVEIACKKLHRDFKDKFRYASISGPSAKHDIQKVGLDHVLKDEDILTMVISR
jgi:small GTP-binding protein